MAKSASKKKKPSADAATSKRKRSADSIEADAQQQSKAKKGKQGATKNQIAETAPLLSSLDQVRECEKNVIDSRF